MRRVGVLGLRARLTAALVGSFFAALALLGFASLRLTDEARATDRRDAFGQLALAAARLVDRSQDEQAALTTLRRALVGDGGVETIDLVAPVAAEHSALPTRPEIVGRARTRSGSEIWVSGHRPATSGAFVTLIGLYVAVTGVAMVLLAYVVLTRWIVRPVDTLIDASERLARGRLDTRVPLSGVAELIRLADAFNTMARAIRTDRAQIEAQLVELHETTRELESTQEQVIRSAKLASIGRLAAGVAHEVGNPLAAIAGLLELARAADAEPAERDDFLRRAQQETERISKIITDLLDFSRLDVGESDSTRSDLVAVVHDVVRLTLPLRRRRANIDVEAEFSALLVRGRPERLTQMILNLLLNALDATADKGRVRIVVSTEASEAVLSVLDDGPGIDPSVADHLFEPFVTTKGAGQGTGLGLAVTHALVERLGGRVEASNRPEGGAVFTLRLPRDEPAP